LASHVCRRFIRASLALNQHSFVERFSAIQCAAGAAFEAVDLNIESRNDELIWEMTSVSSASPSYETRSSEHLAADGPYKCQNCRSSSLAFSCALIRILIVTELRLQSHCAPRFCPQREACFCKFECATTLMAHANDRN
jgi:hypothetical protein